MGTGKVKLSNVCYLITGISIILIITILSTYYRDIEGSSWEVKKEIQINSTRLAAGYMQDFFKERETLLSVAGRYMQGVEISNGFEIEELFPEKADLFDSIDIIGTDGSLIYGSYETKDIKDEIGFEKALGGKCAVSEEFSEGKDGNKEMHIYAPVIDKEEKVTAVLAAAISDTTLSDYIENNISGPDAYAAVINNRGRIMYGSSNIEELIGKAGTSYFSYLKACKITTDGIGTDYIQNNMRESNNIFLEYKYEGGAYVATCIPIKVNDCYLIHISSDKGNVAGAKSNTILMKILVLDIVIVFGLLLYYIISRAKILRRLGDYEIVDRQEGAALFEYTFSPKKIEVFGNFSMVLGKKFKTLVGEAVYDVYDYVHEDDASIRGRLHEFFDSDMEYFSSEVRILEEDGNYGWFRLTGTMFRDRSGKCERFIGKIVNANKQISMEKNLVQRAENDLLTGVLNKKTMESKISALLSDQKEGRNYIFFMIDLDNFKKVNDTLGHIYGDKAIADTAKVLTSIFHNNVFIGRLGGDEFAVFAVYDAFDEESLIKFIIKKAEKVCEANCREYSDGANTVKITSSVGISIGPKDGSTFEVLYKKADEALYSSKNTGKNKYTIIGKDL